MDILCERRTYEDKPIAHAHSYGQLIIPIHGTLSISVDQRTVEKQQNIVFVPPETAHSFYAHAYNQFFVFDAPVFYFPSGLGGGLRFYSLDGRWQAIRCLLSEEVGNKPTSGYRLTDLFRYISGLLAQDQYSSSIDYIRHNFDKAITIDQLAAMEHFNPTYYAEWFKRKYGDSPISYIRHLRFDKAKELLASTDYTIMQIAQQVGYENQSTLTKLFQQEMGITPRAYREKSRKRVK
ncbi:helix-turn-helix domain-containing protein [Sporomusa malonica]|uniref:Transcriptional regulator, AraC family n=1 Tax=Sporomusa malonica TaxID=112901 RepID=A0A1W2DF79_9FIRM|nr:AraC family transcriptional regulator [Sporomusa malonica]SMC96123.1 transcriptional regulator, AraC family [Sporomusa malonica]